MAMLANKRATLVGLTLDIRAVEGFFQSLIERPVLPTELLAHRRLKVMDLFLLHVTSELDFRILHESEGALPSP